MFNKHHPTIPWSNIVLIIGNYNNNLEVKNTLKKKKREKEGTAKEVNFSFLNIGFIVIHIYVSGQNMDITNNLLIECDLLMWSKLKPELMILYMSLSPIHFIDMHDYVY